MRFKKINEAERIDLKNRLIIKWNNVLREMTMPETTDVKLTNTLINNYKEQSEVLQELAIISYLNNLCNTYDTMKPLMALKYDKTSTLKQKFNEELLALASYMMMSVLKYDPETYYDPALENADLKLKWIKW